jgi:hypothetical protein
MVGEPFMAENSWTTLDIVVEVVKVAAALLFLYVVFDDLTPDQVFERTVFDWSWFRAGIIALAYFLSKKFFEHLKALLWECWLYAFYGVCIITLMGWAGAGTHIEDADPLFGGGMEVVDFLPTDVEKDLAGSAVFVNLLVPALVGAYVARREAAGKLPAWLATPAKWTDLVVGRALRFVEGAFYVAIVVFLGFVVRWLAGEILWR